MNHSIIELIPTGQENAISMRRLSDLAGISQRATRAAINRERIENGAPIIGNDAGYYLPDCEADLTRYLHRKQRQHDTCGAIIASIEAYLAGREAVR